MIGFTDMLITLPHVKSGRLRALAVTGVRRSELMPELPTVAEAGLPGFAVTAWFGFLAPAATPAHIIARISTEIVKGFRTPQIRERFAAMGGRPGRQYARRVHRFPEDRNGEMGQAREERRHTRRIAIQHRR